MSSRSVLKKLRFLSASPTGPHPWQVSESIADNHCEVKQKVV